MFFKKKTENNLQSSTLKRLFIYLKPYRFTMIFVLLLVLLITAFELYRPILIGNAIDLYLSEYTHPSMVEESFYGILKTALLYLVVLLASFACNASSTWILQKTGQKIIYHMREEVYEHILSLHMQFFDTTPVGKIVTRITSDTEAINEMYSTILIKLFKNCVKILGFIIVMLSIDVKMALISFVLFPIIIALSFLFRSISRKAYRITRNKITDINTSGMKLIQIFAREKEKYKEFEYKSKELYKANFREVMVFAIFRPSIYLLSVVSLVIILYFGSSFVLLGSLSIGTLYIFVNYITSLFDPIQELAEQLGTLQSSIASAEKIFSILDVEAKITNPDNPIDLADVSGKIEFKNVWFAYENEDYVFYHSTW